MQGKSCAPELLRKRGSTHPTSARPSEVIIMHALESATLLLGLPETN